MSYTLKEKFGDLFAEMVAHSKAAAKIDETKVYEEANPEMRKYMFKLLDDTFSADSGLGNLENFKDFYEKVVKQGKSGLILMEHYTNLDLPAIIYLLQKVGEPWADDFASRIVAVAGMKLNEASAGVRTCTEGFTRVVIYPTRSLNTVEAKGISQEELKAEEQKARKINFAAMRAMDACKKRGLREIDSYRRLFDYMLLVGINGNCLRINPDNPDDMLEDILEPGKVTLTAHPVLDCKKFREDVLSSLPADEPDPKQKTVDQVMQILDEIHNQVESQN